MNDSFASPKRRIERAKQHISTLKRRTNVFFKKQPYAKFVETDANVRRQFYKIRLVSEMPVGITDSATEAIEALRAALDLVLRSSQMIQATLSQTEQSCRVEPRYGESYV